MLASKEFSPRELARELGRDETDVSRRLRRLERAGLVVGEWRRVAGRNVRVYRLAGGRLCLRVTSSGVTLDTSAGVEPEALAKKVTTTLSPPKPPPAFTGRARELRMLSGINSGLGVVVGLPGIGKTSLLAKFASEEDRPTAWYTFTGLEDLRILAWKLSLYLSLLGDKRLFEVVESGGFDVGLLSKTLAESMDKYGMILVLDDYHRVTDKMISLLVSETAQKLKSAVIVIASRRRPTGLLASVPGSTMLSLSGLSTAEAREALSKMGVEVDPKSFSALYTITRGHPLLLRMFAELAAKNGVKDAVRLLQRQRLDRIWRSIIETLPPCEAEVLDILAELGQPAPAGLVKELCTCHSPGIALYRLVDSGFVDETSRGYTARELVLRLKPRRPPRRDLLVRAGDWFLSHGAPEDFVAALGFYTRAGNEKRIVKLIRRRMESIGIEMTVVSEAYGRKLLEALERAKKPYTRAYILSELARTMRDQGRFKESYSMLNEAHRIALQYRDKHLLFAIISLKLWFYPLLLSVEEAESLIEEAEKIVASTNIKPALLSVYYSNLARYYGHRGRVEKVLEAVEAELEADKMVGNRYELARSRAHYAIALAMNGRVEEAIREAEEALGLVYFDAPSSLVALIRWILAELYTRADMWREAYKNATEAYMLFKSTQRHEGVIETLGLRILAFINMGARRAAYRNARRLVEYVENNLGTWRSNPLAGLAAVAAYAAAGRDYTGLVEQIIKGIRESNARIPLVEFEPYIKALQSTGAIDVVEKLEKYVHESERQATGL
jgi:ATP/maltotriose-dependent transcriptional regulator MalT